MNQSDTIKWVVAAVLRLVAGYVAVKLGKDAVSGETWTALGDGLAATAIAVVSIWTSVKGRRKLLNTTPPSDTAKV